VLTGDQGGGGNDSASVSSRKATRQARVSRKGGGQRSLLANWTVSFVALVWRLDAM